MCGRYYIDDVTQQDIEELLLQTGEVLKRQRESESKDVFPNDKVPVITFDGRELTKRECIWGFQMDGYKNVLYNARSETALEKKIFSYDLKHNRCVIPAKYYYEWDRSKQKYTFSKEDSSTLYMAGFIQSRKGYDLHTEKIYQTEQLCPKEDRFTILTTQANDSVNRVHDRMPVLLTKEEVKRWIFDDLFLMEVLKRVPHKLKGNTDMEQLTLFLNL